MLLSSNFYGFAIVFISFKAIFGNNKDATDTIKLRQRVPVFQAAFIFKFSRLYI